MDHAFRVHSQVSEDRSVTLENLPFQAGAEVKIIVIGEGRCTRAEGLRALAGSATTLTHPTEPVAKSDWDVLSNTDLHTPPANVRTIKSAAKAGTVSRSAARSAAKAVRRSRS